VLLRCFEDVLHLAFGLAPFLKEMQFAGQCCLEILLVEGNLEACCPKLRDQKIYLPTYKLAIKVLSCSLPCS